MRHLIKFLHTLGAIGLMAAMACLLVMLAAAPPPSQLAQYAVIRGAMGATASYVYLPSLALTLIAGLLAMAFNPGYQNAPWALVKLATGILVFEWGFVGVIGPMQQEAELSAGVLAAATAGHSADIASLGQALSAERGSLWIMLAIATVNVVLGVFRPKFRRFTPSGVHDAAEAPVGVEGETRA